MRSLACAVILLLVASSASPAQEHHHGRKHAPYAGLEKRTATSLSEQQIADLRAGRGMGLALAAELNGYPGPLHVLELADSLSLSPEQRRRVEEAYAAMKAEAVPMGERLIGQEMALDRHFKESTISGGTLVELAARIGETQGRLRAIHLKYHLVMTEVLTPDQVRRYSQLRGYR